MYQHYMPLTQTFGILLSLNWVVQSEMLVIFGGISRRSRTAWVMKGNCQLFKCFPDAWIRFARNMKVKIEFMSFCKRLRSEFINFHWFNVYFVTNQHACSIWGEVLSVFNPLRQVMKWWCFRDAIYENCRMCIAIVVTSQSPEAFNTSSIPNTQL